MDNDELQNLVNNYINNQLLSQKGLSNEKYSENELKEKIFRRIFTRRYRKYATTEAVHDYVRERLNGIVDNHLPMDFQYHLWNMINQLLTRI